MTESGTISIAFADDHPLLLSRLASIFGEISRFHVAGTASDANAALELARASQPDVLVMDLSMPGDAFGAISQVTSLPSRTRVVVFTAFSSVDSAMRSFRVGAMGFVLKGCPCREVVDAVETVMKDQVFVTGQYVSQIMLAMRDQGRNGAPRDTIHLSVREQQIVTLLLKARTNKEIASELRLSEKTVKHYMSTLMGKFNARNRVEVVIAARRLEEKTASNAMPDAPPFSAP